MQWRPSHVGNEAEIFIIFNSHSVYPFSLYCTMLRFVAMMSLNDIIHYTLWHTVMVKLYIVHTNIQLKRTPSHSASSCIAIIIQLCSPQVHASLHSVAAPQQGVAGGVVCPAPPTPPLPPPSSPPPH